MQFVLAFFFRNILFFVVICIQILPVCPLEEFIFFSLTRFFLGIKLTAKHFALVFFIFRTPYKSHVFVQMSKFFTLLINGFAKCKLLLSIDYEQLIRQTENLHLGEDNTLVFRLDRHLLKRNICALIQYYFRNLLPCFLRFHDVRKHAQIPIVFVVALTVLSI